MRFGAKGLEHKQINEQIKACALKDLDITVDDVMGQRFIGAGMSKVNLTINGVPGNAVGAYLDGAHITINENAQDATGDTMNDGEIVIHGSSGDATGYAMRGGTIYVEGDVGYRAGIHMKAYKDKKPAIIVGGKTGSFLGEYQAGGNIVILGLGYEDKEIPMGNFCATGMHGGKIYLRTNNPPVFDGDKLIVKEASKEDLEEIKDNIKKYCNYFNRDYDNIIESKFYIIIPNTKSPYKQLYTNH